MIFEVEGTLVLDEVHTHMHTHEHTCTHTHTGIRKPVFILDDAAYTIGVEGAYLIVIVQR